MPTPFDNKFTPPAVIAGERRPFPEFQLPRGVTTPPSATTEAGPPRVSTRLLALDAFRGFTIALMLLVNNIALDTATPRQLTHAGWGEGVRLADFVFPWFLFCAGVAIPFAAASWRKKRLPAWRYDVKILSRAVVLFALGLLLDSSAQHRPIFTLGILQIIALSYLVGALLADLPASRRLLIAAMMLGGYWAVLKFLPIPGVGAGMLGETQNIIYHINITYLSSLSLWGLPAVVPTAALVLLGSIIGDLLRWKTPGPWGRGFALLAAGAALYGAGMWWAQSLPLSKALETPSFILMTAATGSLALGVLYLLLDAPPWPRWPRWWPYPLLVLGANAILAYVAPILTKIWVLQSWTLGPRHGNLPLDQWLLGVAATHFGRIPGGWVFTCGYILVWWVVLWVLYRKKVFLKV